MPELTLECTVPIGGHVVGMGVLEGSALRLLICGWTTSQSNLLTEIRSRVRAGTAMLPCVALKVLSTTHGDGLNAVGICCMGPMRACQAEHEVVQSCGCSGLSQLPVGFIRTCENA